MNVLGVEMRALRTQIEHDVKCGARKRIDVVASRPELAILLSYPPVLNSRRAKHRGDSFA